MNFFLEVRFNIRKRLLLSYLLVQLVQLALLFDQQ